MRIKVQTLKSLLWIGNVLAFAAILGLLAHIFLNVRPKIAGKKVSDEINRKIELAQKNGKTSIVAREKSSTLSGSDIANIKGLNITGRDPPPPPKEVEQNTNAPPPMQPIDEVIALRYHVYSSNSSRPKEAQIIYLADPPATTPIAAPPPASTGRPKPQPPQKPKTIAKPIKVGDKLRSPYDKPPFNAEVLDVTPEGVRFRWGAEEVLVTPPRMVANSPVDLLPTGEEGDGGANGGGAEASGTDGSTEPKADDSKVEPETKPANVVDSQKLGENEWYIGTDDLARVDKEGESILEQVELGSRFVKADGRTRIVLSKVPDDSLFAQRGFKTDDILRKIDGQEMSSRSAIVNYFKANATRKQYDVEIERLGERITKSFRVAR